MRAVDKRTKRTKNKIAVSYIEMLRIKPYLSVTDKDVYTAAGVHKTTFYHHFANLNAVEDFIEETVLTVFEKMLSNVSSDDFLEGRKSFLSLVKSTILPNQEFYSKVLFLNQNVSFIDRINKTIEVKLKEEFKKHTDIDDEQIDVIFAYAVGGRMAVYRKWILGGFAISENAISSVLEKMSASGLESFIY